MEIELEKGERLDKTGFGSLSLIQKPEDFCYGVDAVILAHFAAVRGEHEKTARTRGKRSMDLGTGTGIIPLILSHKTDIEKIYGIEVQNDSYHRAMRNVQINNLENRLEMIHGDVSAIESAVGKERFATFDMVTANPPYSVNEGAIKNENSAKMIARHETSGLLKDFISAAATLLMPGGDFYMIHRPSRLVDVCVLCREYNLEPKGIRFVSPSEGEKPNIFLIHSVKNGNPELKFMKNLNIHEGNGYSKELLTIYEK